MLQHSPVLKASTKDNLTGKDKVSANIIWPPTSRVGGFFLAILTIPDNKTIRDEEIRDDYTNAT